MGRGRRRAPAVIVHVAHSSVDESRELAAHAQQIGADACATVGPTFFRPASVERLVEYCARVASGAPNLPFYYYHMPVMTGVNLPMPEFLKTASRQIPNLAGIKFTDENLMSYSQCLNFEDGRFNILFGRDEILLAALAWARPGRWGAPTITWRPCIIASWKRSQGGTSRPPAATRCCPSKSSR
jgi:N-acetylneuraminate lyase